MKRGFTAAALLTAVIAAAPAHGDADEDGASLAWKYHCVTCHGQAGIANSDRYPNIAGQNEAYLVSRLRYFREEVEPGNQMNAQAVQLSDDDINILAEYFSRKAG